MAKMEYGLKKLRVEDLLSVYDSKSIDPNINGWIFFSKMTNLVVALVPKFWTIANRL